MYFLNHYVNKNKCLKLIFFSWLNIFNKLTHSYGTKRIPPVALARNTYYIRPSVEQLLAAMETSITFIVGRNALERLVSAYRDKIVNAVRRSEHDVLRQVKTDSKVY